MGIPIIGERHEGPNDVAMVALVKHLGFGYGIGNGPPCPVSLMVEKGDRFVTNTARAIRLVDKRLACLDLVEEPDEPQVIPDVAPESVVKIDKRTKEYRDAHKAGRE